MCVYICIPYISYICIHTFFLSYKVIYNCFWKEVRNEYVIKNNEVCRMILFLSITSVSIFFCIKGALKLTMTQTKSKQTKKIGLVRVDYGPTGSAFQLSFLSNTRDFTQIAKMWLSCNDLVTQHLLAENKRAMITTEVSEPGRWA